MRPVNEFHQLTDADLLARLVGIWRDIVACPESTPEQVRRAETMLALPWDRPHGEWTVTQLVTFRTEAMRPDSTL